jgi:hypothetical protein
MRPDKETNDAFLYCLAVAAERTEVQVIFYLAMSNHYHAGVIDSSGRLPEFLEHFHKLFAKHQNALRGRWENFWNSEQTSVVHLVAAEDVLDKMVYTLTNPVKAVLVARAEEWPGATSLKAHLDAQPIHASRPTRFFRADGPMPERATLKLELPDGLKEIPRQKFVEMLVGRIAAVESRESQLRRKLGLQLLGVQGVLAQSWEHSPSTVAPRRRLNPRVACKNVWLRTQALAQVRAFLSAYRAAREMALGGLRAVFPPGTYWLRRFGGYPCEAAPAPS